MCLGSNNHVADPIRHGPHVHAEQRQCPQCLGPRHQLVMGGGHVSHDPLSNPGQVEDGPACHAEGQALDETVVKVHVLVHAELVVAPMHTLRQARVQFSPSMMTLNPLKDVTSLNSGAEPPD